MQQSTECHVLHTYTIGDIIVVCLRKSVMSLKLESAVPLPGKGPTWVPVVTTQTTFALTPDTLNEEGGNGTYAAIKSWEGKFTSVDEFLVEVRKCQSRSIPAVSVVYTFTSCIYRHLQLQ